MDHFVVRANEVTKRFAGRDVVSRVSFEVQQGEVFALLGPNGAGKTTLVRMLIGIIRPDHGRIEVSLGDLETDRLPPDRTGYLPEDRGLYRDIPILHTLVYFGMLRGLRRPEARRRALGWLARMDLADRQDERLDALSKGNQQRVQLIAAVLHRPALAILDEPFTGLDPLSQEFFLDLVRDLKTEGTTIILSAHQMDLVERAADRILLINRGREILAGSLDELQAHIDARARVRLTLADGTASGLLHRDPDVDDMVMNGNEALVTLKRGAATPAFLARTVAAIPILGIVTEAARLHDTFVRAVREDDAAADGKGGTLP